MDELKLVLFSTIVLDVNKNAHVTWYRCQLEQDKKLFATFRWWLDRTSCIAEAREFCKHLDIDVEDTINV